MNDILFEAYAPDYFYQVHASKVLEDGAKCFVSVKSTNSCIDYLLV